MILAELADSCHFTRSFPSQIEQGKAVPSIPSLLLLAGRLSQRTKFFLGPDSELDMDEIMAKMIEKGKTFLERRAEELLEEEDEASTRG